MKHTLRILACVFASILYVSLPALAEVVTKDVTYKDGNTTLQGYLAYDDATKSARPGVLICHQWMGLSEHEKSTARKLAEEGYVVFALDIFGVDKRPGDRGEAGAIAGQFYANPDQLRKRAELGLEQLREHALSDDDRIAAIGFCFGGSTVLELARGGAEIAGVVSIHGGVKTRSPAGAGDIKAKMLVLHGADDPLVPVEDIAQFMKEMKDAKVDFRMISYGHAVHAFTQKDAGSDPSTGVAYNENAARRAWQDMMMFFDEIFATSKRDAGAWAQ